MRKDHRCLTACQKQHRQNEPAGQVDIPTRVRGLCDIASRTLLRTTDPPPVKNNTDTSRVGRHCYWNSGLHDGGSRTHVGTTDVSPPGKNNTDRTNQLVRDQVTGIPDTCRDHKCLTACHKQHRQYEPAGWVDIATGTEVCVTVDPGHM